MTLIRVLLRIGLVVLFVGSVAGCHIFLASDVVHYVPGYGYVVHVERRSPKTDETGQGSLLKYRSTNRYYVFDSEEAARRFIDLLEWDNTASIGKSHRPRYDEGSEDYHKIACATGRIVCVPPGVINRAIDGVTPPVPTAPPPQ